MIVYVNGDSYTSMSDGNRYSEYLGEMLGCRTVNASISGSCNSRIFRTSLRDLIDLKKEHNNIKAIIAVSFPIRTEVWDSSIVDNKFLNDGEFTSIQLTHAKNWFQNKTVNNRYSDLCKQLLMHYNVEAEITKLLQNIILFTAWCKNNNIDYVIFSSALQEPIDLTAPFVSNFYNQVKSDKNVIDIFNFSFTEWCIQQGFVPIDDFTQEIHGKKYIIGHHGQIAHQSFAKFLFDTHLR